MIYLDFEKHRVLEGGERTFKGSLPPLLTADPSQDSNLVDPASSHTLVSKIKPCMSKYKQLYSETANGSLYQL